MRTVLPSLVVVATLVAACSSVPPTPLVHLKVAGTPVENGKSLEMRFDELERRADSSIVEVTFVSGGSVSSSMFQMRGMCEVLFARDERYVVPQRIRGEPNRYRLLFPAREDDVPPEPEPDPLISDERLAEIMKSFNNEPAREAVRAAARDTNARVAAARRDRPTKAISRSMCGLTRMLVR